MNIYVAILYLSSSKTLSIYIYINKLGKWLININLLTKFKSLLETFHPALSVKIFLF